MIRKDDIWKRMKAYAAASLGCTPDDLEQEGTVFVAKETARAPFLKTAAMGKAVVVSASPELLPLVKAQVEGKSRDEIFEFPLAYGQSIYYAPDLKSFRRLPLPEGYGWHLLEKEELPKLRGIEGFENSLAFDEAGETPTCIAFYAEKDGKLIGLAGAAPEGDGLWEMGVDVKPEYRNHGLAAALVSNLAAAILERDIVPFYCASVTNVGSQAVAHRSGLAPCWVSTYGNVFDGGFAYPDLADKLGSKWQDNTGDPVPSRDGKDHDLQYIDGLPCKLKAPFDFGFLRKYGKVFRVFDDQDSGNICFGTEKDGQRYFVKYAGAPTCRGIGTPEEAVERLKAAVPVYSGLRHKNLIELVKAEEAGGGFALVFRWADGDCMGRMYPEAHRRFLRLPVEARLAVFQDILDFFEYTASQGYVAIDFYDGSVLYDFVTGKTTVCDIDFFRKQPCINDMGRMWGSSRFQAPEEYALGAVIDEVTNVYTVGAAAFALFGDYHRTADHWQLSEALFRVAAKAVSDDRPCRQQSIRQFREEWEAALEKAL